jgi:hypothetical protein
MYPMLQKLTGLLMAAMLCAAPASAQSPARVFDPSTLKGPAKGTPNDVMVLGGAHLADLPAPFQPSSLALLNARLGAWKPGIIAIESLSGAQCAYLRQFPTRFASMAKRYCWDPAPARAATGLDVPAATAAIDTLLQNWPAAPSPAQRRRLAALFLAGGEPVSALVQWLRLPDAERHAGDGLDAALVAFLNAPSGVRGKRGEDVLIAAPVAAAVGLERVIAMDDHTGIARETDDAGMGKALAKAWDNPASTKRKEMYMRQIAGLGEPEGIMTLYRTLNEPSGAKLIYDGDFGAALADDSAKQFGRGYVTYWETRNLRMAANIREAIGDRPGSRTLVIVGGSHKWYLEAYLHQMHDVRIVSSDQVLRPQ